MNELFFAFLSILFRYFFGSTSIIFLTEGYKVGHTLVVAIGLDQRQAGPYRRLPHRSPALAQLIARNCHQLAVIGTDRTLINLALAWGPGQRLCLSGLQHDEQPYFPRWAAIHKPSRQTLLPSLIHSVRMHTLKHMQLPVDSKKDLWRNGAGESETHRWMSTTEEEEWPI